MMDEKERDELLIRLDERVGRIDKWTSNHDQHHFKYTMLAWSVALGAIVTLAICVIKLI